MPQLPGSCSFRTERHLQHCILRADLQLPINTSGTVLTTRRHLSRFAAERSGQGTLPKWAPRLSFSTVDLRPTSPRSLGVSRGVDEHVLSTPLEN